MKKNRRKQLSRYGDLRLMFYFIVASITKILQSSFAAGTVDENEPLPLKVCCKALLILIGRQKCSTLHMAVFRLTIEVPDSAWFGSLALVGPNRKELIDVERGIEVLSWLARFIERHHSLHRASLALWRIFPPRLAGFLKGLLNRSWVVGAVAVMIDKDTTPPEVLLVQHSYRKKGAWGLPGGSLESLPGDPRSPRNESSGDDVIETALRREVSEELGIEVDSVDFLRIDAIPYVAEEPGPYRLDFYFRCDPKQGFGGLRDGLRSGQVSPRSPEVSQIRLVPLDELSEYDLYSSDKRLLSDDLPRLAPDIF